MASSPPPPPQCAHVCLAHRPPPKYRAADSDISASVGDLCSPAGGCPWIARQLGLGETCCRLGDTSRIVNSSSRSDGRKRRRILSLVTSLPVSHEFERGSPGLPVKCLITIMDLPAIASTYREQPRRPPGAGLSADIPQEAPPRPPGLPACDEPVSRGRRAGSESERPRI